MLRELIDFLVDTDKSIFSFINQQMHAFWLNDIMSLLRNQNVWIPLYIFLLYKVYKARPGILVPFVLASVLTFAITDYISASVIKPWVGRLRPCYDAEVSKTMHLLIDCGGKYGFPSSHAANHFGLAQVWFSIILFLFNKKWYWVWPWAIIICYAQIYVGKHFPFDMVAGALLGILAGLIVSRLFMFCYKQTDGSFKIFIRK